MCISFWFQSSLCTAGELPKNPPTSLTDLTVCICYFTFLSVLLGNYVLTWTAGTITKIIIISFWLSTFRPLYSWVNFLDIQFKAVSLDRYKFVGRSENWEGGALCVEIGLTWTSQKNQDATMKLRSELISNKF